MCCPRDRALRNLIHNGVRMSAQRNPTPPDSIKLNMGSSLQKLLRYQAVVERRHEVAHRQGRLVPFAGEHDHVTRRRAFEGQPDGPTTVALANDTRTRREARRHRINNGIWRLRTGVIRGQDREIGRFRDHSAHFGTLRSITVTAGTEDRDDSSLWK